MMKRFFAICLLSCVALLPGRGEDDTLKSVYHSLSRLGNNVRNTFAEDSDDRPSPTPRRHRNQTFLKEERPNILIRRVNRRPEIRRFRRALEVEICFRILDGGKRRWNSADRCCGKAGFDTRNRPRRWF